MKYEQLKFKWIVVRFKDKNLTKTDRERGTKTPKFNICILCSRALQNAKCNPIFWANYSYYAIIAKNVYFMLKNNCDFCEDDDASEEESIYLIILNDNQIHTYVCILIFLW